MHERTRFRLHSHEVPYGSGSGQQSVTAFPSVDDSNSYWVCWWLILLFWIFYWKIKGQRFKHGSLQIVRPLLGSSSKQGDSISAGTIIRLQHMRTRKWLHSHLHASPISGNLEVSQDVSFFLFSCLIANFMCLCSNLHCFFACHFHFHFKPKCPDPIGLATLRLLIQGIW